MPAFVLPYISSNDSIRSLKSLSQSSNSSFETAEENNFERMTDIRMDDTSEGLFGNDDLRELIGSLATSVKLQREHNILELERMKAEIVELKEIVKETIKQKEVSYEAFAPTAISQNEQLSQSLKLEPIKWPIPYDHKDKTQWKTTHCLLKYIYKRDVIERKFLDPSDYFMNLFSHAVTGVAKDMITGKFQEMIMEGRTNDPLGLLKSMDDTYRDRNEEQTASLLFYACKQFKDESISSFLPRFQRLLARSPSSSGDDIHQMYQLRNSLNRITKNYLVGRVQPNSFHELVEFLYTTGAQIEEVGLIKTKSYLDKQIGTFDDGTQGIAGGKLLGKDNFSHQGSVPSTIPPSNVPMVGQKDKDGDTIMTGLNKIRAKWVSKKELENRIANGCCIRCGKSGHVIAKCRLLPPKRPETSLNTASSSEVVSDNEILIDEPLKD